MHCASFVAAFFGEVGWGARCSLSQRNLTQNDPKCTKIRKKQGKTYPQKSANIRQKYAKIRKNTQMVDYVTVGILDFLGFLSFSWLFVDYHEKIHGLAVMKKGLAYCHLFLSNLDSSESLKMQQVGHVFEHLTVHPCMCVMAHRNYLCVPWNMKPGHTFELGVLAVEKQQQMGDHDPAAIQAALTARALILPCLLSHIFS